MDKGSKKIVFEAMLREGFIKSSLSLIYNEETGAVNEVVLNHYKYGIIAIKDGYKDVHRWESEDEAQKHSYLSKHYPTTLLNGPVNDSAFEEALIKAVYDEVVLSDSDDRDMFIDILKQIAAKNKIVLI